MSLEKDPAAFKNAVEIRKKLFDDAERFYNSNSFQWEKYPKTNNVNAIGKIRSAVYAFFVKNPKKHVEEILTAVNNAKMNQENNNLPQINADHKESFIGNGCLYIGSVTSETLEKRIKKHWRANHKDVSDSTYALKLCDWINNTKINKKDISVYFCDMAKQKKEIIRAIEDCLATIYHPLLGRRGDSPKG